MLPDMPLDEMWEVIHQHIEWVNTPDSFLKEFLDQHDLTANGWPKALDLGCGVGANCGLLLDREFEVWAMDCSKTAVEKTLKNHDCDLLHVSLSTFEELMYPQRFFDLVVSIVSIEQLLDFHKIVQIIKKVRYWLKPDGTFYLKLLCEPIDQMVLRAPVHLTKRDELAVLLEGFVLNAINVTSTVECGATVSHWVISATPQGGNLRLLPKVQ